MTRLILFIAVLCSACATTQPEPAVQSPFRPVADVSQLMALVIDPAADVVWDSVGTVVTMDETVDWSPATNEEWAAIRSSAMTLAEAGNLLMIGDRRRDTGPWTVMAQNLVEAGVVGLQAAESQSVSAIYTASEHIYHACVSCHIVYWPKED